MKHTAWILNMHGDEIDVTKHWDAMHLFDAMSDVNMGRYQSDRWPWPAPPDCVVIPGAAHADDADALSDLIGALGVPVPVIVVSDEASLYPIHKVRRTGGPMWVSTPRHSLHTWDMPPVTRFFGEGPGPIPERGWPTATKRYDVTFSGQDSHVRRHDCVQALRDLKMTRKDLNVQVHPTDGFMQGVPRREYLAELAMSKIVCCPSGAQTVDSFRLYEAVECGAVPIVENFTPDGQDHGTWNLMYPVPDLRFPFPVIGDWRDLPLVIDDLLEPTAHAALVDECQRWWEERKQDLRSWLVEDCGLDRQ